MFWIFTKEYSVYHQLTKILRKYFLQNNFQQLHINCRNCRNRAINYVTFLFTRARLWDYPLVDQLAYLWPSRAFRCLFEYHVNGRPVTPPLGPSYKFNWISHNIFPLEVTSVFEVWQTRMAIIIINWLWH
jgi:hypothetical protein